MPRTIKIIIFISALVISSSSCQNKEAEVKEIDYTQLNNQKSQTESKSITSTSIAPTFVPSNNNVAKITPAISTEPTIATNKTDSDNLIEWPYDLDLKGVTSNKISKSGNLSINYKPLYPPSSFLICPDNENNVLYYVNYGMDNYIYQLKDGISSLLVEKEASFLQLWNNELYFLSNNHKYDNDFTGDIYCYNLAKKNYV